MITCTCGYEFSLKELEKFFRGLHQQVGILGINCTGCGCLLTIRRTENNEYLLVQQCQRREELINTNLIEKPM